MAEDPHLSHYLGLAALILLSAFFSSSEVAFVALSPAKVKMLKEKKTRIGKLVAKLKKRPQRLLATILIGNNIVNIFAAGLATVLATDLFGSKGLGIATGAMTLLILIFGEIFPKAFAQKYAEIFALVFAYPLYLLNKLLYPFTWFFEKSLHALGAQHIERISEEEVVAVVDLGAESGEIKKHEQEMIQNVLEFTDTRVEEVMIPRVKIEALEENTSIEEAQKFFHKSKHSRLPVFRKTIDKVVGVLTLRQIFEFHGSSHDPIKKINLLEPIFTPAARTIRKLFQELQSRRIHLAIVVDEHGGTLGIASLEDLLEEIVGEIEDEEDVKGAELEKLNSKTLLVNGETQLSEVDEILETKLAKDVFETKNVAFLLLEKLGKLPQEGAKIREENVEFTIEKVKNNKIGKVKIEKI
jgi:putative hemolysin